MPTRPTLRPTNTHTHTHQQRLLFRLMTSVHPTFSPHNLFSKSHHDECTSFLITQLPRNKRKFTPKVLKVHMKRIQRPWHPLLLSLTGSFEPRRSHSIPVVFDLCYLQALYLHRYRAISPVFVSKSPPVYPPA